MSEENYTKITESGNFVQFMWTGEQWAPSVCFGCAIQPRGGEAFGCSSFSENGQAVLDSQRRNIKMMIEKVKNGGEDPTNCQIIRRLVKTN